LLFPLSSQKENEKKRKRKRKKTKKTKREKKGQRESLLMTGTLNLPLPF